MGWLRLDDKFIDHPKIEALTDAEFRVWVRVLSYCAEFKTGGETTPKSVRGLTLKRTQVFLEIGLLEQDEHNTLFVHDWKRYNPTDPTAADRMRRLRARNSNRNKTVTDDRNATVTSRAGARAFPSQTTNESTNPSPPNPPSAEEEREGEETNIDLTRYWQERERALAESKDLERLSFDPPTRKDQP